MAHASSITPDRVSLAGRLREPAVRGAQLLALTGFALAQPLFDILGKNAEFFAVRGSTPSDIVLFALVVTFGAPVVLLAIESIVGAIDRRAGLVLHHVFLGGLGAVFGVQVLKRNGVDSTVVLVLGAVLVGAAIAVAVWRVRIVSTFVTILAGASLIFLGIFLFDSRVEELVFPEKVGAAATNVRAATPVVYLLLDEFPEIGLMNGREQIDAKRFPNFARLARTSNWYRSATTLSASTTVAVPVILTGNPPVRGALPIAQNYPDNLFTLLANGYRLNVTESQTRLCPAQFCRRAEPSAETRLSSLYSDARTVYLHLLSPPALEDELPAIDESWGNFGSDTGDELVELPKVNMHTFYIGRVGDFNRFLASFRAADPGKPSLYFLHLLMPHGPWLNLPDGKVRAVASPRAPGRSHELWWSSDLALQAWQRHLLQVGYTDSLVGRLVDRLKAVGLWDRSLVIVDPDHGISFRGGDLRRDPTRTNFAELAFIPLFVKLPRQHAGRVIDRHVTTEDVLPTIADVLDVKVPWHTTGRSLLAGGPKNHSGKDFVQVGKVRMPYLAALDLRRRSLARQLRLFGTGDWDDRHFAAIGPYRGLVGKDVGALNVATKMKAQAVVDSVGSRLLRNLPAGSPFVPSPLSGKLIGLKETFTLALALNGRIAAVAPAYVARRTRFSLLPSDRAFRPGRNDARIFVVEGPVTRPELRELTVTLSP